MSVGDFLHDLRYGARILLRTPAAATVAVLALGLGIGVNISAFIALNAMVLHPLPFPHMERVMTVWETVPKVRTERDAVAPANFLDFERQNHSFTQLAAYQDWNVNLTGVKDPERVQAALVSCGFFTALGTHTERGRTFAPDECEKTGMRVVVVSEAFWRHQLAGSEAAIGEPISLGGETYTVVGVMPDQFDFPLATQIWAPLAMSLEMQDQRAAHDLSVIGRLRPHVTVAEARVEADDIARRLASKFPKTNEARGMAVIPLRDLINGPTSRFLFTILGSAGFVLLLACANVGNLQLARAVGREKEIAVRAALGASRFQIARQLLVESLLIAFGGALLAVFLASWNLEITKRTIPAAAYTYVFGLRTMRIDSTVMLYTAGLCIVTALFCCLPAIVQLLRQRSRVDLNIALREGGRTTTGLPARSRMQSALIVWEIALALILLIGAGFMVKSFQRLIDAYYGYDPKNVLLLEASLPATKYRDNEHVVTFYDRALRELEMLPGVKAAAIAAPDGPPERFVIEGRPELRPGEARPDIYPVSDGYLDAMRIPLYRGRFLSPQDRPASGPVAVVSQSAARLYWPNSDPIGHRIQLGKANAPWVTVVGICGDVVQDALTNRPSLRAYLPYTQAPRSYAEFYVRTASEPSQFAASARAAIRKVDKDLPLYGVQSFEKYIFGQMGGIRASANTMSTYAAVALLLAATGIFAVISYFVVQRTHDIGVRMALGANSKAVLTMTLLRALRLTTIGLAIGLPIAFALMKLMSSALYGIVKLDASTFVGSAAVLAVAAFAASYFPAQRASKIDPIRALRVE